MNPDYPLCDQDRDVLRRLNARKMESASSDLNNKRRQMWKDTNDLRPTTPPVLIETGVAFEDVFDNNTLECREQWTRNMERGLRHTIWAHEEVKHDAVVEPGMTGHGLGIDFDVRTGPVTLLNMSQFDAGDSFKLIYSIGEIVPGDVLSIGNPNCRVKVNKPIHEFFDDWCQQPPSHHIAIGMGDQSEAIEAFAETMDFSTARV
jgi:hypothetical protein